MAEQKANEVDFSEDKESYIPDPAAAATYIEPEPDNQ